MKQLIKFLPITILIVLSYWAVAPLFTSGFYPMHDDTQVARVSEMKNVLAEGVFPVRWVENLGYGYGYPIFNFYAPLAYYVGGFFNLIGFDSLVATKIMIGIGTVLSGIAMYLLAKEFWGRVGGLISGLLYIYIPYHAVNIYVRGAVSELWAYAFIPFVFLGLYKIYKASIPLDTSPKELKSKDAIARRTVQLRQIVWFWISVTAFSYAAIILSHNLTALMVTPFIAVFVVVLALAVKKRQSKIYLLPFSLFIGVLLATFYWLPVGLEMKYTDVLSVVGGGSDYKDHFVCVSQLWNSQWGYAGSAPGCLDGISFKIGKAHILLALVSFLPIIVLRKNKRVFITLICGWIGLLISIFLTLEYSKFIWDFFKQMSFFQFPWRFLAMVSFFISFLGGAVLILLPKIPRIIVGFILAAVIIYINADAFVPSGIVSRNADAYTDRAFISWETSKLSDEYLPPGFQIPKSKKEVPKEKIIVDSRVVKIISQSTTTQEIQAVLEASKGTSIKLNISYFPAWQVTIDGKKVDYKNTSTGLQTAIPEGRHTIRALYVQTPVQQIANILSLTGVIIVVIGIISHRKDLRIYGKSKKSKNK